MITILFQDLRQNGGVRQALKLVELDGYINMNIGILVPNLMDFKLIMQFAHDVIYFFVKLKNHNKLIFVRKEMKASKKHRIITTSKKTLNYVCNIESEYHIHYCQHIETWDLYKSNYFKNYCVKKSYPNSSEFFKITSKKSLFNSNDHKYLNKLYLIKNFLTVSSYLKNILLLFNKTASIKIIKVNPHINLYLKKNITKKNNFCLFFLRGHDVKGDDLIERIIFSHKINRPLVIVISYIPNISLLLKLKLFKIKFYVKPSDNKLSILYRNSAVVVHPSLSEGFGSVPQEGIRYNCKVIASKTGWLVGKKSSKDLKIISKHLFSLYVEEINTI